LILDRFPSQTGFILGFVGLLLFTWGFVYTTPDLLWLVVAWAFYPVLGFLFYYTNLKLSLILGLIFLLYPPIYIASYNSVSSLKVEIVSVQRSFVSSPGQSVTLVIGFTISAPLAAFPVDVGDMRISVSVANSSDFYLDAYLLGTAKGGTLLPFGHLTDKLELSSSDCFVPYPYPRSTCSSQQRSQMVQAVNDTSTYFGLFTYGAMTSLIYNSSPDLCGVTHWDWRTGTGIRSRC
jgi:hypothetical protein